LTTDLHTLTIGMVRRTIRFREVPRSIIRVDVGSVFARDDPLLPVRGSGVGAVPCAHQRLLNVLSDPSAACTLDERHDHANPQDRRFRGSGPRGI
jgi:hypothetical protein